MNKMYRILALLTGLLLSTYGTAVAQGNGAGGNGCSGQFTILFPNGSSVPYNNGSNPATIAYCPNGSGQATFNLTDGGNSGGSVMRVYAGAITVSGNTLPAQTPLATVTTTSGGSATFTLTPGSSGTTNYTLVNSIPSCNNVKLVDVQVSLSPTLNLSATVNGTTVTSAICPGTTVTLSATGATAGSTYTFRDASGNIVGTNTTGTLNIIPTTSTSYTVETNTPNCGNAIVKQVITINANELTASASPTNVTTSNNNSTLTVSGGTGTYEWYANSGNGNVLIATTTSSTLPVTPSRTTQYTVRGTTATGNCVDEAITRVTFNGNTLPVTLTRFSATAKSASVVLNWATATELTNDYFEVQRSNDGQSFTTIGKVKGSGTTNNGATYSYSDTKPLAAQAYYRLRQVDLDGTSSFSSIATVSGKLVASFYPNPSNTSITLPGASQAVQYRVYTATGQTVLAGSAQGGSSLDIQHVPAGLYFLEITTAGQHNVQRFVRQ